MAPQMNPMKQVLVTNYFNFDGKTGKPGKPDEGLAVLRPFVFLNLPLEIRENIYRYAVVDERPLRIAISPSYGLSDENAAEYDCYIPLDGRPKIARTCRSIRNEVLPIYYRLNTFLALVENFNLECFYYWTRHVDRKYLAMIPTVKIILFGQHGVCNVDELAELCLTVFKPGAVVIDGQQTMVPIFESFLSITKKILSATDGDCEECQMLSHLSTIREHYEMQMRKACHCDLPYDALDFTTWLYEKISKRMEAGEIKRQNFGHLDDDCCHNHRGGSCGCCGAHIPCIFTIAQYLCDQDELDDICYDMGWFSSDSEEDSEDGDDGDDAESGSEDEMSGVALSP